MSYKSVGHLIFIILLLLAFSDEKTGGGAIFLNEFQCSGNEARLVDCPTNVIGHGCTHDQDVYIFCIPFPDKTLQKQGKGF